ncbi:MAG: exodeoxyribonuclease VII small subunit [Ruminococcaceae bacterium]|nr:exodeoxyribonuclease VII small subunit [Oscillospiraceae bacterium]
MENISFEDAIRRLEEIVHLLENGESSLDASLELFEEGVALVKVCNGKLDAAEQKVTMLTLADTGEE